MADPGFLPHTHLTFMPMHDDMEASAGFVVELCKDKPGVPHPSIPVQIVSGNKTFTVNIEDPVNLYISMPLQFAHNISAYIRNLSDEDATLIFNDCRPVPPSEREMSRNNELQRPPFLPLVFDSFDPKASRSWVRLTHNIEQWLNSTTAGTSRPLWLWGVDLFWLAFVAAFPDFLSNGSSPSRITRIPLSGVNLAQRARSLNSYKKYDNEPETKLDRIRMDLWEEFQQRVTLVGFAVF